MNSAASVRDERLASLTFPLGNSFSRDRINPVELIRAGKDFWSGAEFGNLITATKPEMNFAAINIGSIQLGAAISTPCYSIEEDQGYSTVGMICQGDPSVYSEARSEYRIHPGDIFVNPRTGGSLRTGYLSCFFFRIEHRRLERTIMVMGGGDKTFDFQRPLVISNDGGLSRTVNLYLWTILRQVQQLLTESNDVPATLNLDDQIYRILAHYHLSTAGVVNTGNVDTVAFSTGSYKHDGFSPSGLPACWGNTLEGLVAYIEANLHRTISLTDLQAHSHYSARSLQYLFKEKFECTPIQYVRRQRLIRAFERLQKAERGDTVSKIARDCGYRSNSLFAREFQSRFGVKPSVLLRAAPPLEKE